MLFWRFLAYTLFLIALFLSIFSLFQMNFSLFLWALFYYFLSTIILCTIKKLYQEPFKPNNTNYRRQRDNGWLDFLEDFVNILEIFIEFPAILFRILLSIFKYINPFD